METQEQEKKHTITEFVETDLLNNKRLKKLLKPLVAVKNAKKDTSNSFYNDYFITEINEEGYLFATDSNRIAIASLHDIAHNYYTLNNAFKQSENTPNLKRFQDIIEKMSQNKIIINEESIKFIQVVKKAKQFFKHINLSYLPNKGFFVYNSILKMSHSDIQEVNDSLQNNSLTINPQYILDAIGNGFGCLDYTDKIELSGDQIISPLVITNNLGVKTILAPIEIRK